MLFENESDEVHLCQNCDAEYTVVKIDDDEGRVAFCPYCGEPVDDIDGYDEEELIEPDDEIQ